MKSLLRTIDQLTMMIVEIVDSYSTFVNNNHPPRRDYTAGAKVIQIDLGERRSKEGYYGRNCIAGPKT